VLGHHIKGDFPNLELVPQKTRHKLHKPLQTPIPTIHINWTSTPDDYKGPNAYYGPMNASTLAVSIITYRRSHLLDLCLQSLSLAMSKKRYPIYILIQDADPEDLAILKKHSDLITETTYVNKNGKNVEELINNNRISAWEIPLIARGHQYVICLEDDVEVSPDIFDFTEEVLAQNVKTKNFWGINYGSFEKPDELGTYSKLHYGIHGPASLVGRESIKKFKLNKLKKFGGAIPWDAWVEPLVKTGFMATSNVSRYRDNGHSGTHMSLQNNSRYFQKLNESFVYGLTGHATSYFNSDIEHQWRADCSIYNEKGKIKRHLRFIAVRLYQIFKTLL
jgi:hypothetical protein